MFMYKYYTLVWTGNSVVYSVCCHSRGMCGQAVNTSNSGSAGLQVQGSSLAHRVVSLDKKLYSTLCLFTQVYKWVPATYCWGGGTLRWTSIPSRGE